jgi:antitoxin (DNA-binding transcriptional repressor) of toxin-antitoxin stability system
VTRMVIMKASVTEVKANLSRYLRFVARGGEVEILDRGTPVARVCRPHVSPQNAQALIDAGLVRARNSSLDWMLKSSPIALQSKIDLMSAVSVDREET